MYKKIGLFLILFFVNILNINAYTDSIDKISMDIFIDDSGTAYVEEVWETEVASGTENYKVFENLQTSQIVDFTVKDEVGTVYEYQKNWDITASRLEKKNKNGIVYNSNGIELCWGVGEYGYRTYTLNYTITNFVQQYNDSQAIYFGLISYDMNPTPQNIDITISSNHNFNEIGALLWGYGYEGIADIIDGKIILKNTAKFQSSNYVTFLVELPNNNFNTVDYVNDNFNKLFDQAEVGVENKFSIWSNLMSIIIVLFQFLIIAVGIVAAVTNYKKSNVKMIIPSIKDTNYYRDIPCKKDIFRAYVIGKYSGLVTEKSNLIGAILLKWIKEKKVTFIEVEGGFFTKGDKNAIDLSKPFYSDNIHETELYNMFLKASKGNKALEKNEFSKWYMKNYTTVNNWFSKIESSMKTTFQNEGIISKKTEKVLNLIPYQIDVYTDKIKEEAIAFQGLKKFLKEFTLISEKNVISVHMWEEYLIFAQLLGIADEVEQQFKKLYPDIAEQTTLNHNNITYINMYTGIIRRNNTIISSRRSSGGGGFSSSGGGGGSRGGGGGGGRR